MIYFFVVNIILRRIVYYIPQNYLYKRQNSFPKKSHAMSNLHIKESTSVHLTCLIQRCGNVASYGHLATHGFFSGPCSVGLQRRRRWFHSQQNKTRFMVVSCRRVLISDVTIALSVVTIFWKGELLPIRSTRDVITKLRDRNFLENEFRRQSP